MASTVAGASGRVYVQGEVLQRDYQTNEPRIFKVEDGDQSFVFKPVSQHFFETSQKLAAEFASTRQLRTHVGATPDRRSLVYPFYRSTLLRLLTDDPGLPPPERLKILRVVAEAVQKMHSKNWIHLDIKPDNILVNWTCDEQGNKTVTDAALGDFDLAFNLPDEHALLYGPRAIGNVMWRSPEAQTGEGLGMPSDVFSFGLVVLYASGAGDLLLIDNWRDLKERGVSPEQETLIKHFTYFGPATEGLLKRINNKDWRKRLTESSRQAELAVKENPMMSFQRWGEGLGPAAVDMISSMMKMDPAARITMAQVLEHSWWQED